MIKGLFVYLFMRVINFKGDDMKKKLYCFNCNKDVLPSENIQENTYIVRKKEVVVKEEVLTCPYCNNELINDNLSESLYLIYNEYLKLYGLSFEKLKEIRKSYNLSQELFAKALNWGKKTITRYEKAESLPQSQYLAIYKKIENDKNEFINILKSNKSNMDDKTYFKIYDSINTELDLKTINVFLYVLKNNFLTKTQIMKNLFAIDFESFKETNVSITKLNYAHGTYGPVIDKKEACLNYLIKHNYVEMVNNEDDIILFKPSMECDLSLFTKEELKIIDKVLNKLKGKEAIKLTNWSHTFKGWIETKDGEAIDYSYAKDFDLSKGW